MSLVQFIPCPYFWLRPFADLYHLLGLGRSLFRSYLLLYPILGCDHLEPSITALMKFHFPLKLNRSTNFAERGVLWMVVFEERVIICPVEGHQECPTSIIRSVLVTSVEHIAVEKECVSGFHLSVNQWTHLVSQLHPA